MRLPQDVANLLAVAIRDVIWFRDAVRSFLESAGVPRAVMLEVARMPRETPTIKRVHFVLDRLAERGDEGYAIARRMLTQMYYWNDYHSIPADKKDQAIASLNALREANKRLAAQTEYQEEQERQMQAERAKRGRLSELDHRRLQSFRDEFDEIHPLPDRQLRGNRFQDLLNRVFEYYAERSEGPFSRTGEQVDGLFYFDKHWYYVEIRWRDEKSIASDVSVLRDRAKSAFGGDTKALLVSFNGFSEDCLQSLQGKDDERVILMDGLDFRAVLDCAIGFDVLLAEKQADIVQNKRPFIGVRDVLLKLNA